MPRGQRHVEKMKFKRAIAWVLCALYLLATVTEALASLTCECRGMMRPVREPRCAACCCAEMISAAGNGADCCRLATECDCTRHSTEIELYTSSHGGDSEKYIRCIVSELPPSLAAEAPAVAQVLLPADDARLRPVPLPGEVVRRGIGLRAPPARG